MSEDDIASNELRSKAMVDGYRAGAGLLGEKNEPPEPYKGNSSLMV